MAASLQTENPRRNPAADDGGHHDGNINFRFFIGCGLSTDTLLVQNYSGDTINPTNQAPHHTHQQLTQFILLDSFRTTTTIQPMAHVLKKG
jgi:hypothetical protein